MRLKKKGNVLTITLILLTLLIFGMMSFMTVSMNTLFNVQKAKEVQEMTYIENVVLASFKYDNSKGLLISDYFENDQLSISYTVDDMGDYFYIETTIIYHKQPIRFNCQLDKSKNYFTSFNYF